MYCRESESALKAPILLIPVVISSIPIKSSWVTDWDAMLVKNSDRIEKNINSTPIRTKRSRQVSQISFNEGSEWAVFEAPFPMKTQLPVALPSNILLLFLFNLSGVAFVFFSWFEFCKRKRSIQSKNDVQNGKYAHKRKTNRIFAGSASEAEATKPDKNSGLGS